MKRILLVEDNAMNRDLTRRQLERSGYTVLTAPDGAAALSVVWIERPDLILMDLSMPILDGWTVTRQLKASPETRHIPVIALTAHAMAGDREKALAAGCDEYETKPVRIERLLPKIAALLPPTARP